MNEKYLKTKEGSIEDVAKQMQNKVMENDYQDKFKKALDKEGKPLGHMTGAEKKSFFNKVDKMHTAKDEQATKGDIDKFHKKLDNLVHKSFGHSSDEKKMKKEEKDIPKGHHKMPDGTIMKDSEHKKEQVTETHTTQTAKANAHQRSAGGEKSPISHMVNKSIKEITANDGKTFAQMRAEIDEACWDSHKQVGTKMKGGKQVPNCVPKNEDTSYPSKDAKIKGENPADKGKKEQETGEDTRDTKKKTMSGQVATTPEMNPKVDYKY